MNTEETEEPCPYPYPGQALPEQSEGSAPDSMDGDYASNKALQSLPAREMSTLQRYSEDPTSILSDENKGLEADSYVTPTSRSVAPGTVAGWKGSP